MVFRKHDATLTISLKFWLRVAKPSKASTTKMLKFNGVNEPIVLKPAIVIAF